MKKKNISLRQRVLDYVAAAGRAVTIDEAVGALARYIDASRAMRAHSSSVKRRRKTVRKPLKDPILVGIRHIIANRLACHPWIKRVGCKLYAMRCKPKRRKRLT